MRRLAASSVFLAAALGAAAAVSPGEVRPWADWVEPDFPFFSAVLDARRAGPGFPQDNLTPRGLILNLGHDCWACFDTDLLRVSALWQGYAVTPVELAPISYHKPEETNFVPTIMLPTPRGKMWLANGIYPGWQAGAHPVLADPRKPGPTPGEVGRGPLDPVAGRFLGLRLAGRGVLLDYSVGGSVVCESMNAGRQGAKVWTERHFKVRPATRLLWLVLAGKAPGHSLSVAVRGAAGGAELTEDGQSWSVRVPPHARTVEFTVILAPGQGPLPVETAAVSSPSAAPQRWPQVVETRGELSAKKSAYVVDDIPLPLDNPWRRNVRLADIQFFRDGSAAAVTIDGDVWLIDGLVGGLSPVRWRRFASGLHEPLSLAIRDDQIFVFDRNGIWRLRDTHGSGEADSYELFSNAWSQTAAVRDHACSIKLAPDGSFVIAKGGSQDDTLGKDNGKVLRISPDGRKAETLGWGFRMPFIGVDPATGAVTASDQQGFYVPSTPVYLLARDEYHGFLDDFVPAEKYPAPIAEPMLWIPHPVNPSAASQTWLAGARMGPLNGALVLVGYNRPEIFQLLLDRRHPRLQAAAVSLTSDFTFAPLNAAVDPADGQLYAAGFRIYGSTGERISGLARVRYTGAPSLLPREVVGMDQGILLRFDVPLDPATARNPASYVVGRWNYRRSHHYGSGHYKLDGTPGQDRLAPSSAYLSEDGKSVFIGVPGMRTGVWQMHVGWSLASRDGAALADDAYFTPYALAPFRPAADGFAIAAVDLSPRKLAPPVAAAVSAEEGRRLSGLLGCVACHTTNGTVGTAHLAPSWKGLFGTMVTLDDGSTRRADEDYIRDHIFKRTARHVQGYENSMPDYTGIATDAQAESLILYLKTLR